MPAVLAFRCVESRDHRLAAVSELEGLISGSVAPTRALVHSNAMAVSTIWMIWAGYAVGTCTTMTLGAIFDLSLSTSWADGTSGWGNVLAEWGEFPGYLSACSGAAVLLTGELATASSERGTLLMFVPKVLGLAIVVALTALRRTDSVPLACVLALLPFLLALPRTAEARARLRERLRPWRPVATHLVLLFLLAGTLLMLVKDAWGRARPRMVLSGDPHATYGASFLPNNHCQQATPPGEYNCVSPTRTPPHVSITGDISEREIACGYRCSALGGSRKGTATG